MKEPAANAAGFFKSRTVAVTLVPTPEFISFERLGKEE